MEYAVERRARPRSRQLEAQTASTAGATSGRRIVEKGTGSHAQAQTHNRAARHKPATDSAGCDRFAPNPAATLRPLPAAVINPEHGGSSATNAKQDHDRRPARQAMDHTSLRDTRCFPIAPIADRCDDCPRQVQDQEDGRDLEHDSCITGQKNRTVAPRSNCRSAGGNPSGNQPISPSVAPCRATPAETPTAKTSTIRSARLICQRVSRSRDSDRFDLRRHGGVTPWD